MPNKPPREGSHWLTIGFLLAPTFLAGAVHAPVLLGAWLACALGAALARWRARGDAPLSPLALAAALLTATAALQLIPLPTALLGWLSPFHAQARAALPDALGVGLGGPVTPAQIETSLALARWSALALAACALSWSLARDRAAARTFSAQWAQGLAAAAVLQTLIGLGQTLAGTGGAIAGLWQSSRASLAIVSGTFVNGNHAGAFLVLGALAAAGAAASAAGWRRAAWAAAAATNATGAFLSGSRGAILALALCALGLAAQLLWRAINTRRRAPTTHAWTPWAAAALLPLALLAAVASQAALPKRLAWELQTSASVEDLGHELKLHMITAGARMIPAFPWLGQGADASAHTLPAWLAAPQGARISFIESDPLQILLDFGILAGGAALALALYSWWAVAAPRAAGGPLRSTDLGLAWGLAAWCVSAAVSFNVEILGLALPALASATALLERRDRLGPPRHARALTALLMILIVLGGLGAARHLQLAPRAQALSARLANPTAPDADEARALARAALEPSPNDGRAMGQAALLLLMTPDGAVDGLALARRAVVAAPGAPAGALALARGLTRHGDPEAAADAWRAALSPLRQLPPALADELWASFDDDALRARALPPQERALRAALQRLWDTDRDADALSLATELQSRYPDLPAAHHLAIMAALRADEPLLAELFAEQLLTAAPDQPESWSWAARAQAARGHHADAILTLGRGLERHPRDPQLRLRRAAMILQTPPAKAPPGADGLLQTDLEALRPQALADPALRARYFELSAQRWERLGEPDRAKVERAKAP